MKFHFKKVYLTGQEKFANEMSKTPYCIHLFESGIDTCIMTIIQPMQKCNFIIIIIYFKQTV